MSWADWEHGVSTRNQNNEGKRGRLERREKDVSIIKCCPLAVEKVLAPLEAACELTLQHNVATSPREERQLIGILSLCCEGELHSLWLPVSLSQPHQSTWHSQKEKKSRSSYRHTIKISEPCLQNQLGLEGKCGYWSVTRLLQCMKTRLDHPHKTYIFGVALT